MTFPTELFLPVMVFLRIFGFCVSLTGLRQHLGNANVFTLTLALSFGAFAGARNVIPQSSINENLIFLGLSEILLGFCISLPFSLVIASIASSGRVVDLLRGNQIAEQLVPGFEERASSLEKLLSLGLLAGLFVSGLWIAPVQAVYKSFSLPPGTLLEILANPAPIVSFAQLCLRECLWFVAPVFALLFCCDLVALGLTRAAPKLSLQSELAGAKLILGLVFLGLLDWSIELAPRLLEAAINLLNLTA